MTRERSMDRARRLCVEQLGGKIERRLIDDALATIADAGIERAFGEDPAAVVSEWIRDRRVREAHEAHAAATARPGGGAEVVEIRRARGGA